MRTKIYFWLIFKFQYQVRQNVFTLPDVRCEAKTFGIKGLNLLY